MLSDETRKYLAKAMGLAKQDNHELLVLDFDRAPEDGEPGVQVLCSMQDTTPENVATMAREALGYFAQPNLIVN